MPLRYSPVPPLLATSLLLATTPAPLPAQKTTCDGALQLMLAQVIGTPADTSIYVFTKRQDADNALRRLTYLATDSPGCPAAFGLRGLVKQRLARTDWTPKDAPGQKAGLPWSQAAVYDLALAVKDGGPAAVAAATLATQALLGDRVETPWLVIEVGPALLAVPPVPSQIPDTIRWFQRGRLAAWLWRPEIADSAFSAYAAAGGSPDRADLELARIRLALGRAGGDSLYYRAAASSGDRIVRDLRYDLAFVADSSELAAFDRLPAADRPAWLRRFWEDRDIESLHPRGSRLREHYRRVGVARDSFRILSYPRQYELNELWVNRDAEYDDRGLMYIRHGPPDRTADAVRAGACPNTSWLYRRPDGNLILHFVARQNADDWRLVETLANASGESGATNRLRQAGVSHSCTVIDDLLETRRSLDPIYAQLAGNPTRRNWERELDVTTRSREITTATDSDLLRFPSPLDLSWRAYGLLGDLAGQGRMLVVVSVPATSLSPISQNPLAYGFRMRMGGRSGPRSFQLDSVRQFRVAQPPQQGEMITFTTELPVQAGTWRLSAALEQLGDAAGESLQDPMVPVPDGAATTLALSDIVLGDETGGRPWVAPDGPFPLSSTGSYERGEPIALYYEIAGAGGGEIESEITFVRDDGKGRAVVKFTDRADGPILRIRRELNTSRSQPGRYTLTVKVQTANGRTAERQTTLIVDQKRD